ncbi:MAG: aldehyde dehydrogenase family protein [Bacteroidales bacterium]|nr:aldehyde dehydrogenase family protein [Bacteroidales bacterium]
MHSLVENQRRYFQEGNTFPLEVRKEILRKLRTVLMKNERFLAEAIYKDFKKSFYLTVENELSLPYGEINLALKKMNRWAAPKRFRTNLVNFPASSWSVPVPYGVTLVIGPWNYPYMLNLVPAISSLAAGNTVILKPSEVAFHSSAALRELINSSFRPELFHVVEGDGPQTTELLKEKFDKIFFTGSTRVGKIVMKAASNNLTPLILELGGKNPAIVLPDANVKRAAQRIMWGKMHNNGQACVSPDHVYVHRDIKGAFLKELKNTAEMIHRNDPLNCTMLPRVINEKNFDRLIHLIDRKKVVFGGNYNKDALFIEPTVLKDVLESDPIMKEEVFGPILPVLEFSDSNVPLKHIQKRPVPLLLYIFTRNTKMAKAITRKVPSGGVMINETVLHFINTNTHFGGLGESGMGSYHGKAGFEGFSHQKMLINKPNWFELFLKYPPYKLGRLSIFRAVIGRSVRFLWWRSDEGTGKE